MKLAQKIVEIALREVGVEEKPPGSNCGPQVNEYKSAVVGLSPTVGWPWCAAFVCWVVWKALKALGISETATFKRPTTAVAWAFPGWSLAQDSTTNTKKNPGSDILPGDIVVFTFSHIGIAVKAATDSHVETVEGNTDDSGSREGGGVFRKTRKLSLIKARIRFTV